MDAISREIGNQGGTPAFYTEAKGDGRRSPAPGLVVDQEKLEEVVSTAVRISAPLRQQVKAGVEEFFGKLQGEESKFSVWLINLETRVKQFMRKAVTRGVRLNRTVSSKNLVSMGVAVRHHIMENLAEQSDMLQDRIQTAVQNNMHQELNQQVKLESGMVTKRVPKRSVMMQTDMGEIEREKRQLRELDQEMTSLHRAREATEEKLAAVEERRKKTAAQLKEFIKAVVKTFGFIGQDEMREDEGRMLRKVLMAAKNDAFMATDLKAVAEEVAAMLKDTMEKARLVAAKASDTLNEEEKKQLEELTSGVQVRPPLAAGPFAPHLV